MKFNFNGKFNTPSYKGGMELTWNVSIDVPTQEVLENANYVKWLVTNSNEVRKFIMDISSGIAAATDTINASIQAEKLEQTEKDQG